MINTLENIDHQLLLFLNGLGSEWLDQTMFFISSKWFWIPIILLIIFLIIKRYKKQFWIPLLSLIICFTITDQTSRLFKENIKRYRPSHNIELKQDVRTVNDYTGGQYGFFSGHASNSFGIALLSLLFIKRKWYSYLAISWAIIVSYSRIYLGVHFPSDIFVGALFGMTVAIIIKCINFMLPKIRK